MMNELDVLLDVVGKLKSVGVEYMLTGSFAMNYYAEPRMTRDVDIVIALQINNIKDIVSVFKDDYYISENSVKQAIENKKMFNIIHNEAIIKIDFIIKKDTEYRKNEFSRRNFFVIDNKKIQIVTVEDLIISKILWSTTSRSELQKHDIKNLLQQDVDNAYLKKWFDKLKINRFVQEFLYE